MESFGIVAFKMQQYITPSWKRAAPRSCQARQIIRHTVQTPDVLGWVLRWQDPQEKRSAAKRAAEWASKHGGHKAAWRYCTQS